jgi:hypothetical protein
MPHHINRFRIAALSLDDYAAGFAYMAGALGDVDVQYVWRFLRSHKIDLAARKSWCESNDPNFTAKAADVVGLYVAPPEKAIVLCVDEKPSIQALERAQGYLKLPNGRALTGQSHDYKRHLREFRFNHSPCSKAVEARSARSQKKAKVTNASAKVLVSCCLPIAQGSSSTRTPQVRQSTRRMW